MQGMIHDARVITIGRREHLPPGLRRWQGDSIGRWDRDTLVVDTTNFSEKTNFRGSRENLHVVERFTRVDENTIRYQWTVDDPTTWATSWSRRCRSPKTRGRSSSTRATRP